MVSFSDNQLTATLVKSTIPNAMSLKPVLNQQPLQTLVDKENKRVQVFLDV